MVRNNRVPLATRTLVAFFDVVWQRKISKFKVLPTRWTHNSKCFIFYINFNGALSIPIAACFVSLVASTSAEKNSLENKHLVKRAYFGNIPSCLHCMLLTKYTSKWIVGAPFKANGENGTFTVMCSRCRYKKKVNFTLLFCRVQQKNVPNCVPHMQHDCFPHSTNHITVFRRCRC